MGDPGFAAVPRDLGDLGVGRPATGPAATDRFVREILESLRVLVVAGILTGVLVAGVGSRLAMLVLRLTSSDDVRGVESDDGFTIGEVTLSGTYNLLMLGAVVGIIGAAAYQWVRPWLIGPTWFRRVTVGAGAGAVVGSMLIHADGIDFVLLTPTWLAITTFIALPALFGLVIGPIVERVERPVSWTARGRTRWLLPVLLVLLFPFSVFVVVFAAFVVAVWHALRRVEGFDDLARNRGVAWAIRAIWAFVAFVGLLELIGDVSDIAAVT